MLETKGLIASVDGKKIVKGVDLQVERGQLHLIMGPNGAGKSTLIKAIMNQGVERSGKVLLDDEDISKLETYELARKRMFLAYQHPVEVPGVHMAEFLRTAYNLQHPKDKYDPWSFREIYDALAKKVGIDSEFGDRNLNEGFSGGEKKRSEVLQMLVLRPKYAFLDEIDSGLDIDALKNIFSLIDEFAKKEKVGVVVISHNPSILDYLKPDAVHLMSKGEIVKSGDLNLIDEIVSKGYER